MKGVASAKRVPPQSVTLGYIALKDIYSDNHNANLDCQLDIHSDMVSSSTLVALASGIRGSKVVVTSIAPTCNTLDSMASRARAASCCCSDIISLSHQFANSQPHQKDPMAVLALAVQEGRLQPLPTAFLLTEGAFEAPSRCPQPTNSQEAGQPT